MIERDINIIVEQLDSLHKKILGSKFAEQVTESEILSLCLAVAKINEQAAKDVAEVVRCKDCEYGEIDNPNISNQYYCHYSGCTWHEGEHYCSYGERRNIK